MVSLTAAKTSRIFVVSVACVKLRAMSGSGRKSLGGMDILGVHAQSRPVCLHEPPKDVLCSFINVGTGGVLRKILLQRNLSTQVSGCTRKVSTRCRTFGSLLLNTSILLRNKMIDVLRNHRELMTLSKSTRLSAIRF